MPADHGYFSNLIWQIADLLRGPYRPPQYERVMLPMTVLRRFDCVLAPTKARVLAEYERRKGGRFTGEALDSVLNRAAGQRFHNRSPLDFEKLQGDPDHIAQHLVSYIQGFSAEVRRIFIEYFEFEAEIEKMRESHILYMMVSQFRNVDLHPDTVPNAQMGLIFENLIRRFNELANETAGDHFTPREVIRLMVSLLFIDDDALLATPGVVRTLLDPACGTGGMLAEAQSYLRGHHREARLYVYGQDYNKRAYATAASDMLMKQVDHNGGGDNVRLGDSLTEDRFADDTFDYFLTNPPFGVDWKRQQGEVRREHEQQGFAGRFGAGLPRVNDGSLLFLQQWNPRFPMGRMGCSARRWRARAKERRCSFGYAATPTPKRARATPSSGTAARRWRTYLGTATPGRTQGSRCSRSTPSSNRSFSPAGTKRKSPSLRS